MRFSSLVMAFAFAAFSAAADPVPDLRDAIYGFRADYLTMNRAFDMRWSTVTSERMEKLYREWQKTLRGTNFGALSQPAKIDYLLLRNHLRGELDRIDLDRQRLHEMDELLSFRGIIQELERARWQLRPLDPQDAASKVVNATEIVKKLRERVEKGKKAKDEKKHDEPAASKKDKDSDSSKKDEPAPLKVTPTLARRVANAVNDVRGTLKSWYNYYDGFQPEFTWWLKKPYDDASSALEGYAKYLKEEIAEQKGKDEDPLLGDPIGREALVRDIRNEMLPYTPEELIEIGEKEFDWCEAEMKKAAKQMGFGDWLKALAKVKKDYVPPGQQDDFVAACARDAIAFVRKHDLVTVTPLCEEAWRLSMLSPEGQKSIPYVAYGGGSMLVAYAREDMKHEDKLMAMRGNNRHFTRITTAHELIPGHHLQIFNSDRHSSYRQFFSTPFLVEGWSLYWEMHLWDLNYGQTPEDKIGMLFWRMHRAARIIVSLKFHLGQMQPKEMVDFLVNRVGHEKFGATSEVRRFIAGSYSPLYQCGYMIGGLQLRALYQETVGARKMSEREFHDTVLTYGPIPVELIRAGMLNTELKADGESTWKFAK